MRTRVLLLIGSLGLFLALTSVSAQDDKTEVYNRNHIPNKKAVPYVFIRESDVLWEKTIWRMVDLKEKMNLPLYYPSRAVGKRMSLIDLILFGIKTEDLPAYTTDDAMNEFKKKMTKEEVLKAMGSSIDTVSSTDPNTGAIIKRVDTTEMKKEEITKVLIKEKWFFDKQYSTMQVRIIGMCPIRMVAKDTADPTIKIPLKTFWIYFPDYRNLFACHEVFNTKNDAQRISFDDLFFQRRFSSYIYAESNVYDNRVISEYETGIGTILESEKIKQFLFETEHDLWEY
jgi:gliding motility associated protien GldN